MLDSDVLAQGGGCKDLIGELHIVIEGPWADVWLDLVAQASAITDRASLTTAVHAMREAMNSDAPLPARIARARTALQAQLGHVATADIASTREQSLARLNQWASIVLARAKTAGPQASGPPPAGAHVLGDREHGRARLDEWASAVLARAKTAGPQAGGLLPAVRATTALAPSRATPAAATSAGDLTTSPTGHATAGPGGWLTNGLAIRPDMLASLPTLALAFCVPPSPVKNRLILHTRTTLYRLRNCLNISGVPRAPGADALLNTSASQGSGSPATGPGAPPTQYRYSVLIDRAKQLGQIAAQFEAAMLNAMEKTDLENQNLLTARQNIQLSTAKLEVAQAQDQQALDAVIVAQLQRDRASTQVTTYQNWLSAGLNPFEEAEIFANANAAVANFVVSIWTQQWGSAWSEVSQLAAQGASYERRSDEWTFQLALAQQDVTIGTAQIASANAAVRVADENAAEASLEAQHAAALYDFLSTKQLTAEVWAWMTSVLASVYQFFLTQATALAQVAAAELAFERQEAVPPYIQGQYWDIPLTPASSIAAVPGGSSPAGPPSGLTGSARLLNDIFQLDQYAFDTNQRKLQLSKTISLAALDPLAFEQFRQSGVLLFATPAALFDRDFPGHYLRTIRRVATTVIALVPPAQGIKATLSSSGLSRVVLDATGTTAVMCRPPESVALTAPADATGLFQLDIQPELLLPFEGNGVDTSWQLVMPKASNPFDYGTIADVLVTMDYTALESKDYTRVVNASLGTTFSADRGLSVQYDFPDEWYALNNPATTAKPMVVTLKLATSDFPPNLTNPTISQVILAFMLADGAVLATQPTVSVTLAGGPKLTATADQQMISTRRPSGAPWRPLRGQSPTGPWELFFDDPQTSAALSAALADGQLNDIVLIITYSAQIPALPA